MRRFLPGLLKSLAMAALLSGLLLGFDLLAGWLGVAIPSHAINLFVLAMFLGGMCLSMIAPWHAVMVFSLLLAMTVTGMLHTVYFGASLTPQTLLSVITDIGSLHSDIAQSLADEHRLWLLALLAAVAALTIYTIAARRFCTSRRVGGYVGAILIFVGAPIFHIEHNGTYSPMIQPNPSRSIAENSLYTFYATALRLPTLIDARAQEAHYRIVRGKPQARNIVLIMGESCRDDMMSLFGWPEPTTPRLDALKASGGLKVAHGYSAATTTRDSLRVFFNLLYSPAQHYMQAQGNLFALANDQGYKTFVVSTQRRATVADMGIARVDSVLSRNEMNAAQAGQGDDLLFTHLGALELAERNFIVLHQRSMHSPYDVHYARHPELALYGDAEIAAAADRASRLRMQYANAMRYNDYVISSIIQTLVAHPVLGKDTIVLFASDHAEYLGEAGRFGHGHGTLENAAVPYLAYEINVPESQTAALFDRPFVSYYDAATWLAGLMGVTIQNPYVVKDSYYLHGSGTLSEYSAVRYHVRPDGHIDTEHVSPTAEWLRDTTGFK